MREIEQAPEPLVKEVLEFLLFTKTKHNQTISLLEVEAQSCAARTAEVSEQNNRPVWELFDEFTKDLPDEVLAQLPTDGAEQHDHYLYGVPKRSVMENKL